MSEENDVSDLVAEIKQESAQLGVGPQFLVGIHMLLMLDRIASALEDIEARRERL
jgi:hypothetical protein